MSRIALGSPGPSPGELPHLSRLLSVHGVGPATIEALLGALDDPECVRAIEEIGRLCRIRPGAPAAGALAGLCVVFTGRLESMSRAAAEAFAGRAGATVASNLSQNTDLLIAGEGAGSKLVRAEAWGIRVISEAEFLQVLSGEECL